MKTIQIGTMQLQPSGYRAFIPASFPPKSIYDFPKNILIKNSDSTFIVGTLNGITRLLPDIDFFIKMYLRKDATSSSQIEGTLATMIDAIEAEAKINSSLPDDVDDILHYLTALHFGMRQIEDHNFPFSLRFIRDLHYQLLHEARSSHHANPGEFRITQNWVGGTIPDNARFVPPPPSHLINALGDLEAFIHANDGVPVLLKAGLLHAQFETIHPFLDGNGRTGRLLITLYLWNKQYLNKPVLYLSSYFHLHRQEYYDRLEGYHQGKVFEWLDFYLDGVIHTATEAIETVDKIIELREKDMRIIQGLGKRSAELITKLLPSLFTQPIVNVQTIQYWTGYTRDGAHKIITRLVDLGILVPRYTDKTYGQSYMYKKYLDIFTESSFVA
ncbi:MAG TPA: Fic family protein [Anaerolineaceae bacterium]|jgi:Fic family protein|nr:Fic family protein [Anaerolineales bacterium]HOG58995.1 Fic family protein [Anaerolineaceae bacterium]HOR84184.1 Fic family protein [Anaerolineaceae bacterium]HPL42458.1 Fic family protein [Anaerolineaceae bacterium]HPY32584.1 Fic family protein [Anaerolineaceae bacterium]